MKIDVQALDADFYAFSGHKVFGPTGVGILYGKSRLLNAMPPYQGGGDMIKGHLRKDAPTPTCRTNSRPARPASPAVSAGRRVRSRDAHRPGPIAAYEHQLLVYGTEALSRIPGLRIIGTARDKAAVLSFVIDGIHPHDIGTVLDRQGIAVAPATIARSR